MIIRWQLQSVGAAIKCHYLQNFERDTEAKRNIIQHWLGVRKLKMVPIEIELDTAHKTNYMVKLLKD